MLSACSIRVRGVVQGVGFRPFVYRLARAHTLNGWVRNGDEGVEIHLEGAADGLETFVRELTTQPPPAASIAGIEVEPADPVGVDRFTIRLSEHRQRPTVRISVDLAVCEQCLTELFDPSDARYLYPYINCTSCGPRYSVVLGLPYDRPNTTMKDWRLDERCAAEYSDPLSRRFHAQPVACPACGPGYRLQSLPGDGEPVIGNQASIRCAAEMLRGGKILAVKGIGGYHLACDAQNAMAVAALRERKFRKEKPFALMVPDLGVARTVIELSRDGEAVLSSCARPVLLAPARIDLKGVAPDNHQLGVMLPYAPLHHLLFAAGAPEILVVTSANRSSEPIAYQDQDAFARLSGIADSFLVGERPIARRIDDSIVRVSPFGPQILRRARGYAPGAIPFLPTRYPILALGADLKNAITLVVDGQAFVSQHIGDLDHSQSRHAFEQTVDDLVSMYEVDWDELLVVHDLHPQYFSTTHAARLAGIRRRAIQHHRAHVASVLAERGAWTKPVIGVSFDGTGFGDDGSIWGGEIFVGSLTGGLERVAHLRPATLAGGDASAHCPVQAAAGFLGQIESLPDVMDLPFAFPERYRKAMLLVRKRVRTFATTSMGRLFDAAASLLGFTRDMTFEGQAAMWLEQLARQARRNQAYPFPFVSGELDFRPLLLAVAEDRMLGREPAEIARAFQFGVAQGVGRALEVIARDRQLDTVVLSGGVFQNQLLLEDLKSILEEASLATWTNHAVPPNDGGISLGQAALGAFGTFDGESGSLPVR